MIKWQRTHVLYTSTLSLRFSFETHVRNPQPKREFGGAKKSSHENIFGNSDKMGSSFADTNRIGSSDNNYARPGGQNVGNYITDR